MKYHVVSVLLFRDGELEEENLDHGSYEYQHSSLLLTRVTFHLESMVTLSITLQNSAPSYTVETNC